MELKAVRVSFELWKQMVTQGYTSGGIRCIQGLPDDALLVRAFYKNTPTRSQDPDPVFVFSSDKWGESVSTHSVVTPEGNLIPQVDVIFRTAECRTCKSWSPEMAGSTSWCWHLDIETGPSFGCAEYGPEPRETDA